jgi:hypothetical protein
MSMLDNIVTMDESAVLIHMPETKQQSKQWLAKGTPGPIKAKVHDSRKKQMVLAFFDSKALTRILKVLKEKRLTMTARNWWFHWDNSPVHTAAVVTNWMVAT